MPSRVASSKFGNRAPTSLRAIALFCDSFFSAYLGEPVPIRSCRLHVHSPDVSTVDLVIRDLKIFQFSDPFFAFPRYVGRKDHYVSFSGQ